MLEGSASRRRGAVGRRLWLSPTLILTVYNLTLHSGQICLALQSLQSRCGLALKQKVPGYSYNPNSYRVHYDRTIVTCYRKPISQHWSTAPDGKASDVHRVCCPACSGAVLIWFQKLYFLANKIRKHLPKQLSYLGQYFSTNSIFYIPIYLFIWKSSLTAVILICFRIR